MIMRIVVLMWLGMSSAAMAQDRVNTLQTVFDSGIMPGFERLEERTSALADAAKTSCTGPEIKRGFVDAFGAWNRVSHLRFGPSEEQNRAFALAFWPDPRGKTPKAVRHVLLNPDPAMLSPDRFRDQSIALRGFYALEFLLFDPGIEAVGTAGDRCALLRAITADIHATSQDLREAWAGYRPVLLAPAAGQPYRNVDEVLQALFKSASTGLQVTADMRFGRPLGTFEKPRPRRAEAWRSRQSLASISLAVEASGALALALASDNIVLHARLKEALQRFQTDLDALNDPALAGVATPQGRLRVEALLTRLTAIRQIVDQDLGRYLGVTGGFNALDGD